MRGRTRREPKSYPQESRAGSPIPIYGAPGPERLAVVEPPAAMSGAGAAGVPLSALPSDVCFVVGTARMTADGAATLETMANRTKKGEGRIEVRARATASETKDPQALSARRLQAVVAALVKLGAPEERIVRRNMGAAPFSPEVSADGPPCIEFEFQARE